MFDFSPIYSSYGGFVFVALHQLFYLSLIVSLIFYFYQFPQIRSQGNSAMQRYASDQRRTHLQLQYPLPPHLPPQPASLYESSGSTRSRSLWPPPTTLLTDQLNLGTVGPLVSPLAPTVGETAQPELEVEVEVQGWKSGSIREAQLLASGFPHSGQPDAVARNRTFLQDHQNSSRTMDIKTVN